MSARHGPRGYAPSPLREALREAVLAALAMAVLSFPVILLRAEPDESNRLILQTRWSWLLVAMAAGFAGRFAMALVRTRIAAPKPITAELQRAPPRASARSVAGSALSRPRRDGRLSDRDPARSRAAGRAEMGRQLRHPDPHLCDARLGAEHRRRPRGPARSRLCRLLCRRRLHLCAACRRPTACRSGSACRSPGILAALWGIILGFPVLRLRGDYLAIVTLAFGEIIRIVLVNWSVVTNGDAGIASIPRITFFGLPFTAGDSGFAAFFGLKFSPIHRVIFLYYLVLVLALLTNAATLRLRKLPIGRAWEALREDEIACRSLGIDTTKTKLTAFALGAMFGGFAGAFFAVRQGFVSPSSFNFIESATILAIVVLGGRGSQIGVALAAFAIIGLTEILRELDVPQGGLRQRFRSDAISHAARRFRDGDDDEHPAARLRVVAHALRRAWRRMRAYPARSSAKGTDDAQEAHPRNMTCCCAWSICPCASAVSSPSTICRSRPSGATSPR